MATFEEQLKDSLHHAYEIERELGGGGMSRVFIATDRLLGRKIVVKVLSPELVESVNRARFRREIQVAAQLQHPHIVTLLSAGEQGDIVYYTMPFIDGESLKSAIQEKGALPVKEVIRVLYDVVDAISYAHGKGVIHRDIKPANILRSGVHSMVTDFGVAKALDAAMGTKSGMTATGMAMGTPAYMAPEQLAGDPDADHRVDIYAVGLLAYELLCGQSPFSGATPAAVMAALFTMNPTPLNEVRQDVPKKLSDVIMQCLAKDPAERPPNAETLMTLLDSVATTSGEIRTREYKVPTEEDESLPPLPPVIVKEKTPVEKTFVVAAPSYEPAEKKGRGKFVAAGLAALALIAIAAFLFSQRGGSNPTVASASTQTAAAGDSSGSALKTSAATPGVAPAAPVMTSADSLAIAQAVAKRIAQTEAARKPGQAAISADSLKKRVQREVADSISRAKTAAAAAAKAAAVAAAEVAAPVAPPVAPPAPAATPAPAGKRSVGISVSALSTDNPNLSTYSRALNDALRNAVDKGDGFAVVSGEPDVLISTGYVGTGDTVTVRISIRDMRRPTVGIRTLSAKVMPAYPQYYVAAVVQAIVKVLDGFAL